MYTSMFHCKQSSPVLGHMSTVKFSILVLGIGHIFFFFNIDLYVWSFFFYLAICLRFVSFNFRKQSDFVLSM